MWEADQAREQSVRLVFKRETFHVRNLEKSTMKNTQGTLCTCTSRPQLGRAVRSAGIGAALAIGFGLTAAASAQLGSVSNNSVNPGLTKHNKATQIGTTTTDHETIYSGSAALGGFCPDGAVSQNADPKNIVFPNIPLCLSGGNVVETRVAESWPAGALAEIGAVKLGATIDTGGGGPHSIDVEIHQGDITNFGSLNLIASTTITVPAGAELDFFVASFSPAVVPDPNEPVVIAIRVPDLTGNVFPGGNTTGNGTTSYIWSPGCGIDQFLTLAAIGFADANLAIQVCAEAGEPIPGACCFGGGPADCEILLQEDCEGDFLGAGSTCDACPIPEICPDLTGDEMVGPADLLFLVDCWGPVGSGCEAADINGDGVVDWFDLLILLENWGCFIGDPPCGDPDAGDCCEANGTPNCDDLECCEAVCALDSFCCEVEWDALCAQDANDICEVCQPDVFPACEDGVGDCCSAQDGSPGCDNPDCCNAICSDDPFCCETNWDGLCAGAAEDLEICDCNGDPPPPSECDCDEAGGVGCPENQACENCVCGLDAFCCETSWDGICAGIATNECANACCDDDNGDPPPPGSNCCEPHGGTGCDDPDCEALICDIDPFCCDSAWDGFCADQANDFCDVCDGDGQPELGACCDAEVGDPVCQDTTESTCTANAGTFQGVGTSCAAGDCDNGGGFPACENGVGDCCSAQEGSPGCEDENCCTAVCSADPFCCDVNWDSLCASAAADICSDICQP
jgi:hypothetical protein